MNKKILHLSPTDIRYDSRILKELKAVQKIENTTLVAFGIDDSEGHKYETEQMPFIKVFNIATKNLKFLPRPVRYFLNLIEAFIRMVFPGIKYKPDVIHCHDTLYLPIAKMIKLFCGSKLIYDAHELESDKAGQSKILSKYTLFIEKMLWKDIDILISVSPSIIDWYDKHLGKKKSVLILNSPLLDTSPKEKSKNNYLREKFNIPEGKKIFLYLGIISEVGRGVNLYLDVFQRKEVDSHIVFIGYGEYVDEIKKIALNNENIHYHPAVPHHQVVEVSTSADVGLCLVEAVSLSDYYCLPNKLFEYAFSELYILASDFPDIRKIVDEYDLGKCSSLNAENLFEIVKDVQHSDLDNRVKKDLYPLSWNFQESELLKLYHNILKNKE
ncbi:glycosyltransferase [Chryseobacterium cucumeris]|uniref:glycosyltransferase n=1 Tax=Chryseobacterium cucumeris TaxID=1813611 RepID=UPI003207EDE8